MSPSQTTWLQILASLHTGWVISEKMLSGPVPQFPRCKMEYHTIFLLDKVVHLIKTG